MSGYSLRHPVQRNFILRILNTDAQRAAAGLRTLSPTQARAQALKANGARDTHLDAMPDTLRQMLYPGLTTSSSSPSAAKPAGRITRVEVVDAAASRIEGHLLIDVYRQGGSSTYAVMNSEPAHKTRMAQFICGCGLRNIPVTGDWK